MEDKTLHSIHGKMNGHYTLEKVLLEPYAHLLRVKGKQFHNRIVMAFNHWFKVPEDKLQSTLEIMSMVLDASLLFDDIQDSSVVRRGMPAAHCIYGLPLTINAALQVLAMALKKVSELVPNGLGVNIYAEQFFETVYGQGSDIYWRENFICPTETEYREMLKQKTGGLMSFGLRDDYCNLKQQEALEDWPGALDLHAKKNNNFCEDITEGKFSLPIIHAMTTPEGPQVLSILRQRSRDVELKEYCVTLLEKSGSLQYTRDALVECDRNARAELARLGGNPFMEAVLDGLLSWKEKK